MTLANGLAPAVVAWLLEDGAVAAVCGARVYARELPSAPFPNVAFGPLKERAWNAGAERGAEVLFALHCHAREGEREAALAVARVCAAALEGAPLTWDGARVVALFFSEAEAAPLRDGVTWRAAARFRALVEGV
jgi:hypothetical protein